MADTDYTRPAPTQVIHTTNTIGDPNITDQLKKGANGLFDYPSATKSWVAAKMDPTKSHTVFTRDIITTELPGADGTGNGSNTWQNATAQITYTDEAYGEEV